MPRPKESKNITKFIQKKIIRDLVKKNDDKELVAKEYNISVKTVYDIVSKNISLYGKMKNELLDSITIGSGVCSNLALNALKSKDLTKEKPKSLAYIAESMGKLALNQPGMNINIINNSMPTSREDLITWLNSATPSQTPQNIVDVPTIPSIHKNDNNDDCA